MEEVKSVHLKNLLHEYRPGDSELSMELSSYASTLHQFYNLIADIEKINFKENVDQSITLINNLIMEEIRAIISEKVPKKSINKHLPFSGGVDESEEGRK